MTFAGQLNLSRSPIEYHSEEDGRNVDPLSEPCGSMENPFVNSDSKSKASLSESLKFSIAKELFVSAKTCAGAKSSTVSSKSSFSCQTKTDEITRNPQVYVHEMNVNDSGSICSTPARLPSYRQRTRSCLKTNGMGPAQRTHSADQLSFQVLLPGQQKPVTRIRSITFDESVRVRRVPSAAELNHGKTNELWFQSKEYDTIKRKTFCLIRAVQNGETAGVNYCTRGLEKYFDCDRVQRTRVAAWNSVLCTCLVVHEIGNNFSARNKIFSSLFLKRKGPKLSKPNPFAVHRHY